MTTQLPSYVEGDSVPFRVSVYAEDGVTPATPSSAAGTVWDEAGTQIATGAGAVGAGYAKYNWTSGVTAGNYRAVLTVTISAGVVQSEEFYVTIIDRPPAFTTDPGTDLGWVRMMLGDDVKGVGLYPDGRNISDAQFAALLADEGTKGRTLAAALELLANVWAGQADEIDIGPRRERIMGVSKRYADRAALARKQYGGASGSSGAVSVTLNRADGFAANADEEEYTA